MRHKISVAMATYNGEKFIIEQLDSIMNQTFAVDEVIIHDDISIDKTVETIRNYIKRNNYENVIKLTVNKNNLGYASNFVSALTQTTGDYVFFCDQDDIWIEDRVEKMIGVLQDHPEIGLMGSEFEPFKCDSDAPDVPGWELAKFKNDDSLEKLEFNSENIFIGCQGCTMVMTREFLNRIKDYWYEGWAHDEFVWKLALAEDCLYFYHCRTLKRRLHSNNVTLHKEHEKEKRLKYLNDLKKSHEQTLIYLDQLKRENKITYQKQAKRADLLNKHISATQMRIDLIEKRKIFNTARLLMFLDCYHKKRSVPVELLMAFK